LFALLAGCCALVSAGSAPAAVSGSDDDFVFGVVPQTRIDRSDTRLMRGGGVEGVRVWFSWATVEPVLGLRDWSQLDEIVTATAEEGIAPLPYLFGIPTWAAALDGHDCSGAECIPYAPRSDFTRESFAEFAAAAVDRYGPGGWFWHDNPDLPYRPIRDWQVWNEMNLKGFFRPEVDVEAYGELLERAAEAIHAEDPGAQVLLGGMWGGRLAPKRIMPAARYLARLYRLPAIEESFDAIAVHPYGSKMSAVFEQLRAARRVARRNGDKGVAFYITELGWASGGPRDEGLVKTPARQAKLLEQAFVRLYRKRLEWDLHGAYWYAWRDTPRDERVCRWCAQSGLRSVAGTAKPAWYAFRALALR
jgi:hypothetical protein